MTTESFIFRNRPMDGTVSIVAPKPIINRSLAQFVLNLVLCAQFKLKPNSRGEGGIQAPDIDLVNIRSADNRTLGLEVHAGSGRPATKEEKRVLAWYADLLRIAFVEGHPGRVYPNIAWNDPAHERYIWERLKLIRDAVIHSNWKFTQHSPDIESKVFFWLSAIPAKLVALKQNILFPDLLETQYRTDLGGILNSYLEHM